MEYSNILEAIAREKQIKGWSRQKKEALFIHDWDTMKKLAANRLTRERAADSLPAEREPGTTHCQTEPVEV